MTSITAQALLQLERTATPPALDPAVRAHVVAAHRGQVAFEPALVPLLARWLRRTDVDGVAGMAALATLRRPLHDYLAACGADLAGWLAGALGPEPAGTGPAWRRRKHALLAPAGAQSPASLDAHWQAAPAEAALAGLAALGDDRLNPAEDDAVEALVGWLAARAGVALHPQAMALLAGAAFVLAYARRRERHAAKAWVHRQVQGLLGAMVAPAPLAPPRPPGAPLRLTVFGEFLVPGHAMMRCYAPMLEALAQRFDVSLVTPADTRCAEHRPLARRLFYVEGGPREIVHTVAAVRASQPDVLFLPSVGMSVPGLALANLRLAPLQVAGIGHPAPVASGFVDRLALQAELVDARADFPEPPLPFGQNPLDVGVYGDELLGRLRAQPAPAGAPVVGVPASRMKLNAPFLHALEALRARWPEARWRFYPGLRGSEAAAFERRLARAFPGAEVAPGQGFEDYLADLAACRVLLQAFPFGGTNTTLDGLMLGIPVICLDGADMHARIDAAILRAAGLDAWLAQDPADYLGKAARAFAGAPLPAAERARVAQAAAAAVAGPQGGRSLGDALAAAWDERA